MMEKGPLLSRAVIIGAGRLYRQKLQFVVIFEPPGLPYFTCFHISFSLVIDRNISNAISGDDHLGSDGDRRVGVSLIGPSC